MANQKLTELTATTTPVDADLLYVVTDVATTPASKKVTVENFKSGLEPALPVTPSDPANKFLDGNKTWSPISIGSGGFAGNVYGVLEDSDIATYKKLSYIAASAETEETIVVNNNTVVDNVFLYDDALGTNTIPSGTWRSVVYAKVSSTIGATTISLTGFVRDATGGEDDLFTMTSESIENTADYLRFVIESSQITFDVNTTDRFGIRISGTTTRTLNTTITYIVGNGRGMYINTTLPTRHDQLREKNENPNFLHITSAEYNNISGAADVDSNGYLTSTDWGTFNGKQNALTFGIADNNAVEIDSASVADDDFAKFTAQGLEGRSASEVRSDLGLATTDNPQFATIELGAATDTTISRVSAGKIAVEGVNVVTTSSTDTLTNKTIGGALTLEENASIDHDPALSADGKYTGLAITGTAGAALAFGDLITLDKDDSKWELVDISAAAAATGDARGIIGICVLAANENAATKILLNGVIRADANFPAITIGAAVYASTSGDCVVAQPSTVDHVIRVVGYGLDGNSIYFNPENDWISHIA